MVKAFYILFRIIVLLKFELKLYTSFIKNKNICNTFYYTSKYNCHYLCLDFSIYQIN